MTDKFHTELKDLKKGVSEMARFAFSMLQDSQEAFIKQDADLATTVVDRKDRSGKRPLHLKKPATSLLP